LIANKNRILGRLAILMVGVWLLAPRVLAVAQTTTTEKAGVAGKTASAKKTRLGSYAARRGQKKGTKPPPKSRRQVSSRRRRAQLQLQPERVAEIQRALIQAGYLNEEPTGKWGESTRDAMRRYQADHGFPVTGLPEAKTLMKLGLGPHPLPEELDSSAKARASAESTAQDNSASDQLPAQKVPPSDPAREE
jgi:peptidoglycan hydrolase-like protein with peptidoglycan-binding domain